MAESKFEVDAAGVRALVRDDNSPVRKDMQNRLQRVRLQAKANAGKSSGELSASIRTRTYIRGNVLFGEVYTNAPHALLHHEGTRPHIILPQRAELLRFKVGGRIVYANRVMHPGTRPNPFLRQALREVRF